METGWLKNQSYPIAEELTIILVDYDGDADYFLIVIYFRYHEICDHCLLWI